jgi:hypothetical protein
MATPGKLRLIRQDETSFNLIKPDAMPHVKRLHQPAENTKDSDHIPHNNFMTGFNQNRQDTIIRKLENFFPDGIVRFWDLIF